MPEVAYPEEIRKALEELQQYFSDQLAPLMVADSVGLLLKQPPELIASGIHSWTSYQNRINPSISLSDYLYHAVMKIYMMTEYRLIPAEEVQSFLSSLAPIILEYCPPKDRELLKKNLTQMGTESGPLSSEVELVFRPGGPKRAVAKEAKRAPDMEVRRFSQIVRRLERRLAIVSSIPVVAGAARSVEAVSDVLVEAARSANEASELNRLMDHLRGLGISVGSDDLIRALGQNVPGWSLPSGSDVRFPENSYLNAMRRMIAKAEDSQEAAARFVQLVKTAVERFNEGFLPQAGSMIELAEKIIEAKEVEPRAIEVVRTRGDENLDQERLRKYAENPEHHALLRKVLNFFAGLTPQGLLEALRKEPRRDRRRLLLLFLECHGEATRAAAMQHLRTPLGQSVTDEEAYFRRNLIYLLRRIPFPEGSPAEEIVDLVLPHLDPGLPAFLVKEALAYLPQLKHHKAEEALQALMERLESMLLHPEESMMEARELLPVLDRIVASLIRIGTPGARKAAIEHALKKKAELGDTMARLTEFSSQDLTDDPDTVNLLLTALNAHLPLKRFGVFLPSRDMGAKFAVEALSGTPAPQVRKILQELAQRYSNRETGRAAARALVSLNQATAVKRASEPQGASLMGDVEVFGLPNLLQNLSSSQVTGTFLLKSSEGQIVGTMLLEKGLLYSCSSGKLSSEEAFYQLLETPRPGTFQFVRSVEQQEGSMIELQEILPLLLEGMRRYDELQQARSIVPDEMRLKTKTTQPTPLPEERDGLLFRELWTMVEKGATPLECESDASVDSYRVRRLLAHWMETGAIEHST